MSYAPTALASYIEEDLNKMKGKLEPVKTPFGRIYDVERTSPLGRCNQTRNSQSTDIHRKPLSVSILMLF